MYNVGLTPHINNGDINFMRFPNVCGLSNDKDNIFKTFEIATGSHYDIHEHNNITETFDW